MILFETLDGLLGSTDSEIEDATEGWSLLKG